MSQPHTIIRRSARTSYISTIIGIALVLFMLGLVSWMVLSSKKIVTLAKESLQVDIFFKDNTREADMLQLEKKLNAEPFVKSARFKSREDVIKELELEEGAEELDLEDSYKELSPTIEIYLHEEYAHLDSLQRIEERLKADYGSINEFYYNKEMLQDINTNSNFLIYIILGIALLLLIVAIALISVIIIASLIGTFIPILLDKFGIDPALATGPFITTSNDICGILIYFSIAKLILGF